MAYRQKNLELLTGLACGASLACSVGFWVGQQQTINEIVLAAVFAIVLELGKFEFFPIAVLRFSSKKYISSFLLFIFSSLLLAVSIIATISFLETSATENINQSKTTSTQYISFKNDITALETEITSLNNLISIDSKSGYRSRGYEYLPKLEELRQSKREAIAKLENMVLPPSHGSHSIFSNLSKHLHYDVVDIRQGAYILLAILIDFIGIAGRMLLATLSHKNSKQNQEKLSFWKFLKFKNEKVAIRNENKKNPSVDKPEKLEQKSKPPTSQAKNLSKTEKRKLISEKLLRGEYGQVISVSSLMENESIGHSVFKKIITPLIEQDLINKIGNKYHLANSISPNCNKEESAC